MAVSLREAVAGSCLAFSFLLSASSVAQAQSQDFHLDYTGGLFGYYRIEEPLAPGTTAAGITHPSEFRPGPVDQFLTFRDPTQSRQHSLLLGMGDNFAPEFGASLQWNEEGDCKLAPTPTRANIAPETLYKNEGRLAPGLLCDNVARFLLKAGYRAIVPGREDFIYTARWTREMALMMKHFGPNTTSSKSVDGHIHLLAGNLRVPMKLNGSDIAKTTPLATSTKDKCPLLFSENLFAKDATKCVASGSTELMDWIDRMDRALDQRTGLAETLKSVTDPSESANSSLERQKALEKRKDILINQATQMQQMLPGVPDPMLPIMDRVALLAELKQLANPKNFRIGPPMNSQGGPDALTFIPPVNDVTMKQLTYIAQGCTDLICPFGKELLDVFKNNVSTGTVLLSETARRNGRDALLRSFSKEEQDIGYTIAEPAFIDPVTGRRASKTLLIGVVGKETMQEVSPSNLMLCSPVLGEQFTPQDLSTCRDGRGELPSGFERGFGRVEGSVSILDPVTTVDLILRAIAVEPHINPIQHVVVMAQMPATEAQELATHLHSLALGREAENQALTIDVVLSEAQDDHASSSFDATFVKAAIVPVLTPRRAFTLIGGINPVKAPIYQAVIKAMDKDGKVTLMNTDATSVNDNSLTTAQSSSSTGDLLACEILANTSMIELPKNDLGKTIFSKSDCPTPTDSNTNGIAASASNQRQTALIQFLLSRMQLRSHADVALLQRRDVFLDRIPDGYADYDVCGSLTSSENQYCRLHVALDRVLWKGDYTERVMVTGKDLKQVLSVAKGLPTQESTLAAQDTRQQWLVNLGVTTPVSTNLTKLESENNTFFVAQDSACVKDNTLSAEQDSYCVNGQNLIDDRAYWIATNDHLANDTAVYKALAAEPARYHTRRSDFLTTEITETMIDLPGLPKPILGIAEGILKAQLTHQQRPLMHLDYSKLVASFTSLHPQGGNQYVADDFQGAADSRASAASKQDLDLEALVRMSRDFPAPLQYFKRAPVSLGIQSDLEYDRTLQGSVTKNKTTGLVPFSTPNYTINNYTVGGFLQIPTSLGRFFPSHFGAGGKSLPRTYVVLAPYQYSRQLVGTPLIYPFAAPSPSGNLTIRAPRVTSFLQKFGGRTEWGGGKWWAPDFGSYAEAGGQFGIFNNLLSGVTDPTSGIVCSVSTSQSLADCLKANNLPQSGRPSLQSLTTTTHTAGLYWDIHISKGIKKTIDKTGPGMTFNFDSKGDYFRRDERQNALSTQTRYDVPLSFSLGFPILQNLTLAPTYSPFLYQNQHDFHSLVVNSFSISARWYFARDSAVPIPKQIIFKGPASTNQSAKTK